MPRYQHGAVFVGPRMHISGGAVGGGKMVADGAGITILDTSAGVWATQSAQASSAPDAAALPDWARRCAQALLLRPSQCCDAAMPAFKDLCSGICPLLASTLVS